MLRANLDMDVLCCARRVLALHEEAVAPGIHSGAAVQHADAAEPEPEAHEVLSGC